MKKIKIILVIILLILVTYTLSAAAKSIINISEQKNINNDLSQTIFEAEITFYIYEGEGCACNPIPGAEIIATSGDGEDSGVTDADGIIVLNMIINSEYLVTITANDYNIVKYNFNVIDDQTFKFHLGEKKDDDSLYNMLKVLPIEINPIIQQLLSIREGKNLVIK